MRPGRPIRVLEIISRLGMGGVETWLMEVLRLWSKDGGVEMDILATSGKKAIFDDEAQRLGASIHYIPYGRALIPRFAKEFRRLLRARRYDAIHDHQHTASGWHFLMGMGLLPPIRLTHTHCLDTNATPRTSRLIANLARPLAARYSTHIIGTSLQLLDDNGLNAPRFRAIPKAALYCGFDPMRFIGSPATEKNSVCREFGWPANAKIILLAGRIDQSPDVGHFQNHKNSAFALAVGTQCAHTDPTIHLLFVGKPSPAVPVLERRAFAAGLAGRIHFAGIRKDIPRLMLASDVLLFPSVWEGLGMVAVEAQATGLPVLASTAVPRECVVIPELVRFMSFEDGPSKWATLLLELIARARDVESANQLVSYSDFAIKNSARALMKLYSTGDLPRPGVG